MGSPRVRRVASRPGGYSLLGDDDLGTLLARSYELSEPRLAPLTCTVGCFALLKPAEQILESIGRLLTRISGAGR